MVSDERRSLSQGWTRSVMAAIIVATVTVVGCGSEAEPEPAGATDAGDGGDAGAGDDGSGDDGGAEDAGDTGDDGDAQPTPKPASSDGPGENLPVPEAPEEVYEDDLDGAEAALRHWFDLYEYARDTGELDEIESFTHEECWPCEGLLDEVRNAYSEDGWYVQEPYEVELVQLTQLDTGAVGGPFIVHEGDFDTYWEGSHYSFTEGARDSVWTARLVYEGGGWQVASLRYEMDAVETEDGEGTGN